MSKLFCVLLGIVFLGKGVLGATGVLPMFESNEIFVNIGEIALGVIAIIIGIYSHPKKEKISPEQKKENERLREANEKLLKESREKLIDEKDELIKEKDILIKEKDQLVKEKDQLKTEINWLANENVKLKENEE